MKKTKTTIKTSITIFFLFIAFLTTIDSVTANTDVDTYALISASPNPVGVNQQVIVQFRLANNPPLAANFLEAPTGTCWEGFTVTIETPDGTIETRGPFTSDATGGAWFTYSPEINGTYKFQMSFPGQQVTGYGGYPERQWDNWFKPCNSSITTLEVQQEPIQSYHYVSLPTEYWSRPIYGENKGWGQISGNWLMPGYDDIYRDFAGGTAFNPYTEAPTSSHIAWTKPLTFGGIMSGEYGDKVYYTGLSYEIKFYPIAISGNLYYNLHASNIFGGTFAGAPDIPGYVCVDLNTGEELWQNADSTLSLGQVFDYESPNQHGGIAYLWDVKGSTWKMYDAFTGDFILTIENVPDGKLITGPNGELLIYTLDNAKNTLTLWNSTIAISGSPGNPYEWYWMTPYNTTIDGSQAVQWNVTIPEVAGEQEIALAGEGYLLAHSLDTTPYPYVITDVCYDLETGKQLWVQNRSNVLATTEPLLTNNIGDGVYAYYDEPKEVFYGYSIETGKLLWETKPLGTSWGIFTRLTHIAYGQLFTAGYDGHIRSFNITDGKLIWDYFTGSTGFESPLGTQTFYDGFTIADQKIYVATNEHSPDSVMWQGAKLFCIDTVTGECLWNISSYSGSPPIIVDGYLVCLNAYDNQIYCYGKGSSKLTVTAPSVGVTTATPITISGTITDISSGASQEAVAANFPNGLPCVSEESMTSFMEAVYQQQSMPTNLTGVPVTINVLDSNGNYRTVGTTTSDGSGKFAYTWTPDIPGSFTVVAIFAGSNAYYGSNAETPIYASELAAAPTPQPTQVQSMADLYFMPMSIAIIIAIIVVGAFTVLALRKRP